MNNVLEMIDAEIARLTQVRALLSPNHASSDRPVSVSAPVLDKPKRKYTKRKTMSAEARKRIGDAVRKRWATAKKKAA